MRNGEAAGRGELRETAADRDRVAGLAAEIIDQHGQRLVREGLAEHLGRAHRRAGIADQRMRHRAHAPAPGRNNARSRRRRSRQSRPRRPPACACAEPTDGGIGHHLRHLGAGAVPRIHRQERDLRQVGAHRLGVVGGDAGGPELLQQHGFEIDEMVERAGHVEDRLAGADPGALRMVELDVELGAARRPPCLRETRPRSAARRSPAGA